jgi:hypothetical protein
METAKNIGIWMDHSIAHLMEPTKEEMVAIDIRSESENVKNGSGKSENLMHNKEQHLQSGYYKKITQAIKGYDSVLLFGPTTAKYELLNLLKADHQFEKVKINVKHADKMTENQQKAFVKAHFHLV